MPSGRRPEILRALQRAAGPLTIGEIAEGLRVHPNTVRFHLDALLRSGQVERVRSDRRTTGRPPLLFRAVHSMDPTGPRHYRLLAEILVQGLATDPRRGAGRAAEAGRAWGRRLAASSAGRATADATDAGDTTDATASPDPQESLGNLMALLDELGFAPEPRPEQHGHAIGLHRCPFLELAEARSDIVCRVHLGMMQGAMQAWEAPLAVDRLDPFVEPDLCLTHLSPADV